MAEVAALSLAANILQVLEYGKKFVTTAWAIYRSDSEGVELLADLKCTSHGLKPILNQLQECPRQGQEGEDSISSLAKQCACILKEMLESIPNSQTSGTGRKRKAAVAAFRLVWKENKVHMLSRRLDKYRDDLNLNLVVSLR
jgi:hypothetical protein